MSLTLHLQNDPIVIGKSEKVKKIDNDVKSLVKEMMAAVKDYGGVGLAAPQVGYALRIIVIALPDSAPFPMINPKVLKKTGQRYVTDGCLSIPGWAGETIRSISTDVYGIDMSGREIVIGDAKDLLSHVLEHEIDHLDGILYTKRLSQDGKLWRV